MHELVSSIDTQKSTCEYFGPVEFHACKIVCYEHLVHICDAFVFFLKSFCLLYMNFCWFQYHIKDGKKLLGLILF